MKTSRIIATVSLAIVVGALCLFLEVKDGGNIDFYWKPLVVLWLVITLSACGPLRRKQALAGIRERWWLQLVVPIILFGLAIVLVRVYEPHPISTVGSGTEPASSGPGKINFLRRN